MNANYPAGCGAVLIVELDGPTAQVEEDLGADRGSVRGEQRARGADRRRTRRIARASGAAARRRSPRWAASAPTTTCRTASSRARSCPRCCGASTSSPQEHGLRVGNVFHAGDGNLHPLVLYDGRVDGEAERAELLARADPRGLHRRRRLDHRRARRRQRQGLRDAADVRRGRPRRDAAPARARSTRTGSRTRARSSRRRASAARCRARTARIRSRRPGLPSATEPRVLEYEPGDLTCIVEAGLRLVAAAGRARRARPAALARPARRPDARRVPARGSLRARCATASARCATW